MMLGIRSITLVSSLGLGTYSFLQHRKPILAEASTMLYSQDPRYSSETYSQKYYSAPPRRKTRLGGLLNYEQLSVGSFTGLLAGYVVGKISKLLVFLLVTGFLGLQFLQSRGFIRQTSALPLAGDLLRYARQRVDVQELLLEQPSFKYSFAASFSVAALYA